MGTEKKQAIPGKRTYKLRDTKITNIFPQVEDYF